MLKKATTNSYKNYNNVWGNDERGAARLVCCYFCYCCWDRSL